MSYQSTTVVSKRASSLDVMRTQKSSGPVETVTAGRSLGVGDVDRYIRCNSASAINMTVPPDDGDLAGFSPGHQITLEQTNTGLLTVVAGSGVTVHSPTTLKAAARFATLILTNVGLNEWTLSGNISAT